MPRDHQLLALSLFCYPGGSGRGASGQVRTVAFQSNEFPRAQAGGNDRARMPGGERNLNPSNMQRFKGRPPAPAHRAASDARPGKTRDL